MHLKFCIVHNSLSINGKKKFHV